jgi:2-dehydro-3-deoxyphosphogluconate aldolase/(4S)-4-hydroxy-2-oxoglutarate aldolase
MNEGDMKIMNSTINKMYLSGIVPVVKIEDAANAIPLAKSIKAGGLNCIEVTFRAAGAELAIAAITGEFPDMLVGAGTVITTEQVDKAVAAGASFIVSPGFNEKVVKYCQDKGVVILPGVSSPSEIEKGMEMGLEVLKFFPAEVSGGVKALNAFAGPYTTMKFIPTGGINEKNLVEYLSLDNVLACGGTWIASEKLIKENKFDEITRLTAEAVKLMLGIELRHVGINTPDTDAAEKEARGYCDLLGMDYLPGNSSIFVGAAIEVMKKKGPGTNGHIAFITNSVDRTYAYLSSKGYKFNEASRSADAKGLKVIYLTDEYAGFAIHFVRR